MRWKEGTEEPVTKMSEVLWQFKWRWPSQEVMISLHLILLQVEDQQPPGAALILFLPLTSFPLLLPLSFSLSYHFRWECRYQGVKEKQNPKLMVMSALLSLLCLHLYRCTRDQSSLGSSAPRSSTQPAIPTQPAYPNCSGGWPPLSTLLFWLRCGQHLNLNASLSVGWSVFDEWKNKQRL